MGISYVLGNGVLLPGGQNILGPMMALVGLCTGQLGPSLAVDTFDCWVEE